MNDAVISAEKSIKLNENFPTNKILTNFSRQKYCENCNNVAIMKKQVHFGCLKETLNETKSHKRNLWNLVKSFEIFSRYSKLARNTRHIRKHNLDTKIFGHTWPVLKSGLLVLKLDGKNTRLALKSKSMTFACISGPSGVAGEGSISQEWV